MSHPVPGSGWMFVTKKNRTDLSDWEWVVYPVAYFEDGVPWFATPISATLRKPSPTERFWGTLVSPGQNSAGAWNELKAEKRAYLAKVSQWLKEFLAGYDNWELPREALRAHADDEFDQTAVTAVLNTSDFECVSGPDGTMYWTVAEKS